MLAINMLPGGHGDCLVLEYGSGKTVRRVLIDAGTRHMWDDHVRPSLLKMPNRTYELFVITHVDEDHIGGSIALLGDENLRQRVRNIWFNGFVHSRRGGNVLGPVDGERLTKLIRDGGFKWNDHFGRRISRDVGGPAVVSTKGKLKTIPLPGGATITLLSPSGPKLERMADVWEKVVKEARLVPGKGTDLPQPRLPVRHKPIKALPMQLTAQDLEKHSKKSTRDPSEANGSSIAFMFEFGGKRALLGADAHADVLIDNLARYGKGVGEERVKIDLVKLAHHGSRGNVTTELIEAIDARKYLLSSNGDNHGHPDDACIVRVIQSSARKPTFYCNYRSDRTEPWVERGKSCDAKFVLPRKGQQGLRVTA